jgi:hypothetical protein
MVWAERAVYALIGVLLGTALWAGVLRDHGATTVHPARTSQGTLTRPDGGVAHPIVVQPQAGMEPSSGGGSGLASQGGSG